MRNVQFALMRKPALQVLAAAVVAAGFAAGARATVVFSDNFNNGSTLESTTNSPTANSTNYDIASAKTSTDSISTGDLSMTQPKNSSTITEAQALFTATPVTLTNVGDAVKMQVTFTDTAGLMSVSKNAIYFGLFHSGGSAPYNDMSDATNGPNGLNSALTGDTTGGVQNWVGYVSQIQPTGSSTSSHMETRPVQTGASDVNQDLLSLGASSSQSYVGGTQLASSGTTGETTLTQGNQYTEDFIVQLTAVGTETVTSNLYAGTSDTGTPIATLSGADSTALYNGFDGLGIGWRDVSNVNPTTMDINSISVSTVPEPASLGLLALAGLALRRRK